MHEEECIALNSRDITLSRVCVLMGVCFQHDTRLTGMALTEHVAGKPM